VRHLGATCEPSCAGAQQFIGPVLFSLEVLLIGTGGGTMCQCASCSLGRASHDARFRQLLWPYDMLVNRVRQACSVHSAKHKRSMFKPCCNPITSQHSLTGGLPPGRTLVVPRTQRRHGSTAARWQKRCDVTCTAPANFAKKASQCPCWSMYRWARGARHLCAQRQRALHGAGALRCCSFGNA